MVNTSSASIFFKIRIHRPANSGEGPRCSATPRRCEHSEDGDPAAEILGPPPPEGKIPASKHHSGHYICSYKDVAERVRAIGDHGADLSANGIKDFASAE
jgi:hypothetical protein